MTKNKKFVMLGVLAIVAYFVTLALVIAFEEGYIQIGRVTYRSAAPTSGQVPPASAHETVINVRVCGWNQLTQEPKCD